MQSAHKIEKKVRVSGEKKTCKLGACVAERFQCWSYGHKEPGSKPVGAYIFCLYFV